MATVIKSQNAVSETQYFYPMQNNRFYKISKNYPSSDPKIIQFDVYSAPLGGDSTSYELVFLGATVEVISGNAVVNDNTVSIGHTTDGTTLRVNVINRNYALMQFDVTNLVVTNVIADGAFIDYALNDVQTSDLFGLLKDQQNINPDVSFWDTSKVVSMTAFALNAFRFNADISNWNVSNVQFFNGAFQKAKKFNADISNWDVAQGFTFSSMFEATEEFNRPLNWNMSNASNVSSMFRYAKKFNQTVNHLNWSNVITADAVFANTEAFNQEVNNLNVSNVTSLALVFYLSKKFNQPVSNWSIQKCRNLTSAFCDTFAFNQSLSSWCTKFNIEVQLNYFLDGAKAFSTENADAFLNAFWLDFNTTRKTLWASRQEPKVLGMRAVNYTVAGESALNNLVAAGWTITIGSKV